LGVVPRLVYFFTATTRRLRGVPGLFLLRRVQIAGADAITYIYDAFDHLTAEYSANAPTTAATNFLTGDHLGSIRVVTDKSGNVVSRHDHLPFGEEIDSTLSARDQITGYGSSDGVDQRFTGKERDAESGLDYFLARYYSSPQGRFSSADNSSRTARISDPQSWHLYAYARNNPLLLVDEDGKNWQSSFVRSERYNPLHKIFNSSVTTITAGVQSHSITEIGSGIADVAIKTDLIADAAFTLGGSLAALELYSDQFSPQIDTTADIGEQDSGSVWSLSPAARGRAVEDLRGANLPSNFPVIDKFQNGIATSIKSIDLNATAYQNVTTLNSTVNQYINSLASFMACYMCPQRPKLSRAFISILSLCTRLLSWTKQLQQRLLNKLSLEAIL